MRRRNKSLKPFTRTARTGFLPLVLSTALTMLAPLFISGQQSKPEAPDSGDAVFSTDTRLVPLNVTVNDKSGRLITNLPQSAFTVYENGVVQPIKLFKREDVPVSLGLVIDNSGSMREKRQGVESAALALVKDSNPQDEVFIINFNDEVYLDADFTSDISKMEQGLTKIDSRGGTAMRDALRLSVEHLKQGAKRDKKVILVVTDGNDNASVISLEALTRLAQQDDVLIYSSGCSATKTKGKPGRPAVRSNSWPKAPVVRCSTLKTFPKWTGSPIRSRTTFATNTRSATVRRTQRWMGRIDRSRWLSRLPATPLRAPEAVITQRRTSSRKPRPLLNQRIRPHSGNLVIRTACRLTKGYRLRPWRSPYLKWRIETWSGIEAAGITPSVFIEFCLKHRGDLVRYLKWAGANSGWPVRAWFPWTLPQAWFRTSIPCRSWRRTRISVSIPIFPILNLPTSPISLFFRSPCRSRWRTNPFP